MTESGPGRERSAITKEMLDGSKKAILSTGTDFPHYEIIGALSGVIMHRLAAFTPPEAKTKREKKKQDRKIAHEEKRRMRAHDIYLLRQTVNALPQQELPEELNLEELNAALMRKEEKMQEEERRRSNRRIGTSLVGALVFTAGIAAGTIKVVYDNSVQRAITAEQSILLKTEASPPTYTGWSIQTAPADKRYEADGEGIVIGEQESIKVKNAEGKTVDTGFELKGYKTVSGKNGITVFIPLKAPYYGYDELGPFGPVTQFPIIDIFTRKSDENADKQELVVLDSSVIALLRGPQGQLFTVLIADTTPADGTDGVYTIMPQREVA